MCLSIMTEFKGITLEFCEILWLRHLLNDLGYLSKHLIQLYCNNKVACDIAHNLFNKITQRIG